MADMNDKMSDMNNSTEEKAKDTTQDNATDRMEQMRRENAEHSANEE